jgi:magnesium transporter
VLHRIADLAVDEYADVIEAMGSDIDEIEEQVFSGGSGNHSQRIYRLKREVLEFHRAVTPLTTMMSRFAEREDMPCISAEVRPYFRDVHDHVLRAADTITGYDRLLTDVLQADLAQVTVQQNADMRKISAYAAIALLPTAVAGIYGMNFDNMPELRTEYGYYVVLVVIAGLCTGLYALLRRNRWL